MDLSQGEDHRLKSKKLIATLFSKGKAYKAFPVIAMVLPCRMDTKWKAGYSVPKKKISRAVDRNLLKRRMREAVRLHIGEPGLEGGSGLAFMLIYVDRKVSDYQTIDRSVRRILEKVKESKQPDVEQH
jgi:ribonuclease P protein component